MTTDLMEVFHSKAGVNEKNGAYDAVSKDEEK
jgi:hypothetical protein